MSLSLYLFVLGKEGKGELEPENPDLLENRIVKFIDRIKINCELENLGFVEFEKNHVSPFFQLIIKKFPNQKLFLKFLEIAQICDMNHIKSQLEISLKNLEKPTQKTNKIYQKNQPPKQSSQNLRIESQTKNPRSLFQRVNENSFNKKKQLFNQPKKRNQWANAREIRRNFSRKTGFLTRNEIQFSF